MAVPEQKPFIEYTANGTTTAFPLDFNCDKAEYLIVTLNGEEAPVGSWTLANDTVTFNVAPLNGVVVNLERNTPFQRTTNYQLYDNSFRPSAVNKDFDLIWWKLQELGYRDQVIWLALVKEIADRIDGDEDLQNQINTIDEWLTNLQQNVNENTNDIAQLVNDLSKEIADRITGDQILKDMFISMIDEAINEGTINALAITHLDSLEALEGITNVWDGRTIYVKDLGNYRYDALTTSWVKAYQDADNVKYGEKTQKQFNDEVKTYLDNFPFYIPYSSLIDDYSDRIELAIRSGRPILLTQDATYIIKRKITVNDLLTPLNITGKNAVIKYDGPDGIDRVFEIQHNIPLDHVIYSLEINSNLKASSCLRIYAIGENANGESNFYSNRLKGRNCRKTLTTQPGDCIHIRGSFRTVLFEYPEIDYVAMAAGAGNPTVSGISGITVTHYNDRSFPISMELRSPKISKIFSEDSDYTYDQDGVKYFSSSDILKGKKANSKLIVVGGEFINCWGRSIKTQCRDTFVNGVTFTRTEGNATKEGNGEINIQTGNGLISGAIFNYSNGHTGGVCISFDTGADYDNTGGEARGCNVYLDDQTILKTFISNYPRDGVDQTIIAIGNKIYGKAILFANSLVNGNKNRYIYKDNQVEEIIAFDHYGNDTLIKAFHTARASGAVTPRGSIAEIEGNTVLSSNNDVILSLDAIPNVALNLPVSCRNNIGFVDDIKGNHSASGAKTKQVFRAKAFGSTNVTTHTVVQNSSIASGEVKNYQLEGIEGGMVFFGLSGAPLSHGILSVVGGSVLLMHSHNVKDSAGVVITNYVNVSNIEPTTPKGIWLDIWRHPDQGGKIVVRNNGAAGRNFNIFQIVM